MQQLIPTNLVILKKLAVKKSKFRPILGEPVTATYDPSKVIGE